MNERNRLLELQHLVIDMVCKANITYESSEAESLQSAAMGRMEKDHGVQVHRWSDETIDTLRGHWASVAEEMAAADPMFKRVWEHCLAFRETHKTWRTRGYLR